MSTIPSPSTGVSSSTVTDAETLRRNRILLSNLYFDVPLSKVPLIYSPSYDISFPSIEKLHPFDTSKWGCICQFLVLDGVLDNKSIVEPQEATEDDLLVVHSDSYLNSLKNSSTISIIMEVPPLALSPNDLLQQKVLHPFRKQVGGTILAAKLAKERGWAINVGGGFHHCSGDKGGVMIIDLDAHQGNGHEKDFSDDKRVYILDIYNPKIYPFSGTATDEYLAKLDEALKVAGRMFDPKLVVYNAGTDILDGDPLGRLKSTILLFVCLKLNITRIGYRNMCNDWKGWERVARNLKH